MDFLKALYTWFLQAGLWQQIPIVFCLIFVVLLPLVRWIWGLVTKKSKEN